jgi:polyhydroxybutyrate depolymerase
MVCAIVLLTSMAAAQDQMLKPGDHWRTLEVDRRTRSYLVHVPASYDGSKPYPVVLIFHGGASNAQQMVRFCGLNDQADQAGFLAVYPRGAGSGNSS